MLGGISAFVALILFITAHEAGHYFAAKATGMKVTEFFLGFGPRLWSFKRGETTYGIKPIPLGAYVKIVGMSALEDVAPEDAGRTYRERPFWMKSVVVLAGVGANFLIAYLMFAGVALFEGRPFPTTEVATVVAETDDGPTAAASAGLEPGDRIVAIDGRPVDEWEDVASALASRPGESIVIGVERSGQRLELSAQLGTREDPQTGTEIGFLGVGPVVASEPIGPIEAAGIAGVQVGEGVKFTFISFGRLLQLDTLGQLVAGVMGGEVPDDVRPVSLVGVVQIGSQASEIGVSNFLFLLAAVNVILGTLNALPLYPLDGGHFAVALYEKLTGRQADIRKLVPIAVMVIGLIAVIGLLAIVLDIVSPIKL